ncbi:hypothetical protein U1K26_000964 [Salmonella enterica]|nr:hypothetical protein [Salmonella enterica]EMA0079699.1 hypothetical protein [Salmonella enterica]EMA5860822.1 hypothetical protein [Salmonella enterica]HAK2952872.1 hypothetical protein [Salmonella enterica]
MRFQGQYFDEESGLHYNRYRYYEPESFLNVMDTMPILNLWAERKIRN